MLVEVYDEDFASSDDFLGHVSHRHLGLHVER